MVQGKNTRNPSRLLHGAGPKAGHTSSTRPCETWSFENARFWTVAQFRTA